jgi:hypothetical protein
MTEQPEFGIRWMPVDLEELERLPPGQDCDSDDPALAEPNPDDPAESSFAAQQLTWAQERLVHSAPGSFDADFLSGIILATLPRDGEVMYEALSGIRPLDEGALISAWFVSGYLSTKLLWGRTDFSSLRFTPELLESVVAAMRLKYDA